MVRVPFTVRYLCLPCSMTLSLFLTSLKLCCAVARQAHGHLQLYTYIYGYKYIFRSNSRGLAPEAQQIY